MEFLIITVLILQVSNIFLIWLLFRDQRLLMANLLVTSQFTESLAKKICGQGP